MLYSLGLTAYCNKVPSQDRQLLGSYDFSISFILSLNTNDLSIQCINVYVEVKVELYLIVSPFGRSA